MYTARQLPDGSAVVLHSDGLTWEMNVFEDLAGAQRFADELNGWVAARPTGHGPELITELFVSPGENSDSDRLLAIVEKLYNSDRQFDDLEHTIRTRSLRKS